MFDLKPISPEALPRALEKAERYRLLNEPRQAESICRDVLRTDPENQQALATLLLSLTDQFHEGFGVGAEAARSIIPRLRGEYERAYFAGVISERWGRHLLASGVPGQAARDWLRSAMSAFEDAIEHSPAGNEDAALRWNACARVLMQLEQQAPRDAQEARSAGDLPLH
ncbi:hypothetical protein RAS1_02650 [Phycisphaerae bacterium RAS1]|nr:hypothetical protein RAS1_02650 [Phycisphaerae bacterium RAS1]